ncbi:LuxR family transcriptional regulator [Agrobacterium tumefaciens]|uniref:LuxR family transcriptional regulator n=1 Tax=Agrobacterium tumefaciens TaxID=358 RepID=UPI00224342E6|nr:LuxR family transcriptional regulator [Agrobacterium tumefaciens]MCW8057248.1 LuxR family transcriptional regulator [Agrobacterium tumefaciens]
MTILEEYLSALETAETADEVTDAVLRISRPLGVTGILVADLPTRRERLGPLIRLQTWNEDLMSRYDRLGYVHIDPVAKHLRVADAPYVWSELYATRLLTPDERRVVDDRRRAGLVDGLTVPIHGPCMRISGVSYSIDGRKLAERDRLTLRFMAMITHNLLDDITLGLPDDKACYELSDDLTEREAETLHYAMMGYKSKQIAHLIGTSIRTVDKHIGQAMKKLHAESRGEAISKAVAMRILKPDLRRNVVSLSQCVSRSAK